MLNAPFTRGEVHDAIHQLGKWKAQGTDGLPIRFYLDHWNIVNSFVEDTVLGMLTGRIPIEKFNHTDIILSPKGASSRPWLILGL